MISRKVYDLEGKEEESIELPDVFSTSFRPDIIRRVLIANRQNKRQPYGADKRAGKKTSAKYVGKRDSYQTMMNREMARMKRLTNAGPLNYQAAFVPQAKGGRRAHPPKSEKKHEKKVNKKERRLALESAIASLKDQELLQERHSTEVEAPIIVDNEIENIQRTKELESFIESVGLSDEIERAKEKKVRSGKGKNRGRKYNKKIGILFVVNENNGILDAASNIAGVDVVNINSPQIEKIAPGAIPRISIWSKAAIESLRDRE